VNGLLESILLIKVRNSARERGSSRGGRSGESGSPKVLGVAVGRSAWSDDVSEADSQPSLRGGGHSAQMRGYAATPVQKLAAARKNLVFFAHTIFIFRAK